MRALLAVVILLGAVPAASLRARGQEGGRPARAHESSGLSRSEVIEQAIGAVCSERRADPLGSVPIDVMQARPSLPLASHAALDGLRRAERLLPVAKELTVQAIGELAGKYRIAPAKIRSAVARVQAVRNIEPDMELRDNAAVTLSNPYTISFGTIFLAGLPSDEGMISVLAHELTHIADGRQDSLHTLFRPIGRSATRLTGLRVAGRRSEELTCDLIGTIAARAHVARTPNDEPLARRLSRSVQHNCVEEDDTDEDHLSPRNTMRALLALDPALARDLIDSNLLPAPIQSSRYHHNTGRRAATQPRSSLTTAHSPSYHRPFR